MVVLIIIACFRESHRGAGINFLNLPIHIVIKLQRAVPLLKRSINIIFTPLHLFNNTLRPTFYVMLNIVVATDLMNIKRFAGSHESIFDVGQLLLPHRISIRRQCALARFISLLKLGS